MRRLFLELVPEIPVGTETGFRHWLKSHPPRAHFRGVVAEESGEVVGWAQAFFDWHTSEEAAGRAWVGVLPSHRGRGVGRALAAEADAHLAAIGARSVESFARKGSEGEAFAEQRGFVQRRLEIFSSVDPREVEQGALEPLEARLAGEGLRLAPLSELRDRPEALHDLDVAVGSDVPGEEDVELRYDEWMAGTFAAPDLSWEGSTVVFDRERPIAFCLLQVVADERRAENDFTATRPEYRGRGLARLVKLASLRWCAGNGIDPCTRGTTRRTCGCAPSTAGSATAKPCAGRGSGSHWSDRRRADSRRPPLGSCESESTHFGRESAHPCARHARISAVGSASGGGWP